MEPTYKLLTGETEYRQSCDTVITLATRELAIFDRDLAALHPNDVHRVELLDAFLAADRGRRLRIVLHEPEKLRSRAPRLMNLLSRFSHNVEVRQTPENLRHLADTFVIADDLHCVRRFQFDQPRFAMTLQDSTEVRPWRDRFGDLWEQAHPCLSPNTTGL